MSESGLRSILQPVLFLGIASIMHGLLFLIPAGGPTTKRDAETTRGVRVKAYVDRPPDAAPARPPREELSRNTSRPPQELHYSAMGSKTASGASKDVGIQDSGSSPTPEHGREGSPSQTEWDRYKSKLGSSDVQRYARESAQRTRQGWKGAGAARGTDDWGKGSRTAEGGSGKGTSGKGSGGDGAIFMDPRVRMIVTSYPSTAIEKRYSPVKYPDLKFKKHEYTSGWWNVYIEIRTDGNGKIIKSNVLRPETDGPLERQFVAQVKKEIDTWSFDPREAEIHVDVRFYVE